MSHKISLHLIILEAGLSANALQDIIGGMQTFVGNIYG